MHKRKHFFTTGRALLSVTAAVMPLVATALPTQTWSELPSPVRQVTAVSSIGTASALNGALATVFFNDGSADQAVFAGGPLAGGAFSAAETANFAIVASSTDSDSAFPDFSISNFDTVRTLTGFRIDGRGDGTGQAAFDRGLGVTDTSRPSTPGSGTGIDLHIDFTGRTFLTGNVDIAFSHPLSLAGEMPVGDLFSTVEVRLQLDTLTGLPPVTQFSAVFSTVRFNSDLDTVVYATPVPEPSQAGLLLAGLGVLLAGARRRAKA